MILVDSSVWIDYLRGTASPKVEILHSLFEREPLSIGDLILLEVLQGIDNEHEFHQTIARLSSFTIIELGGRHIALQAARNYRALRKLGITVRKTIDMVIATWCIENGYELLHSDRDFDHFARHLGLRVVIPPPSIRTSS